MLSSRLKIHKNKFILLFLLSLWTAFLHSALFVDIPKQYPFFHFKDTITPSSPHIERRLELKPDYYLLKIKHEIQAGQSKNVILNGEVLFAFKVLKKNIKETDYFYISTDQIQKDNLLKIDFDSGFPKEVKIRLRNYRKSFMGNNIILFFKPAFVHLFEFSASGSIFAFLSAYLFLAPIFFLLKEKYKKKAIHIILILGISLSIIAINNFLPFTPYVVFISLFHFWFWPILTIFFVFLLLPYRKSKDDLIQETYINELSAFNIRRLTIFVFFGLLTILFVLRLGAVLQNRVPMGHDTFQYLLLQYNLFFNEPALKGSVPQWLPFMTHGAVSHIWVIISQGLLTSILVPFAGFLKNINFIYIFQAGLFFDELVLLVGCVLLAKRYFKSVATILFVASSITFTTISSTQIWWDFHLIYLLPLTLYCFERAIRDASAKYLFLTGLFFVGMFLGNLPYFMPVIVFTFFVLGSMIFLYMPSKALISAKKFLVGFHWRHVLAIVIPILLVILVKLFLNVGMEEIVQYNSGRGENWQVENFKSFLSYGGYANPYKYLEFISRDSNNIDNTIFGGLFLVPFAVLTLLRVRSRLSYAFGATTVIMALFSAGIIIPIIFYYVFPLGKYFRHIGLVAPLVRLFMVFYAGFGFDVFWRSLRRLKHNPPQDIFVGDRANLLVPCIVMLYIFALALIERFGKLEVFDFSSWGNIRTESQLYLDLAQISSGMNQVLVISSLFVILLLAGLRWPKRAGIIGLIFISIHLIDVVSFKVEREYRRVPRVSKDVVNLFDTHNYSFSDNRSQDYFSNDRFLKLVPFIFYEDKIPVDMNEPIDLVGKYGTLYWNIDSFLFLDTMSSAFQTGRWSRAIDEFYNIWQPSSGWVSRHLGFPIPQSVVFRKLSGCDFSKLQLFSKIHILPTENDVAEVLANPDFQGDMLLSSGFDSKLKQISAPLIIDSKNNISVQANERTIEANVSVEEFTFDKLRILVNNNTGTDTMLYYADAWHPKWRAYVDDRPAFIFKTNLGYKSVIVPPGKSEVVFKFGDGISKLLFNSIVMIGICVFCGVIYLLLVELRK